MLPTLVVGIKAIMTSDHAATRVHSQLVHVVDESHRLRAEISMAVSNCGGHAETYESFAELLSTKPKAGAILLSPQWGETTQILAQLHAQDIYLPLILFSSEPRPSQIVQAVHDGAANYLAWPFTGDELLSSCAYCHAFMQAEGDRFLRQRQARALVESLSNRERQILIFMLEGHSNKSMAKYLDLSPRTIEDYRLSTMKKLGVQAASAAIRLGLEAGLLNQNAASPS